MNTKKADEKIQYFDMKQFIISFLIWISGAVISVLPIVISFIYKRSHGTEMSFYEYVFKSSDIMYACVSMVIVAISDQVLGMFQHKKWSFNNTLSIIFIVLSIIYILFGAATYTLYEYSSQEYTFMIGYNYKYFWIVVCSCALMYVNKNLNIFGLE